MRLFLLVSCFVFSLCVANAQNEPARYGFRVVDVHPHDMSSFTQGLVFHEGFLYEGTGKRGFSKLSKVSLEDAREIMSKPLGRRYFGEGIQIVGEKIYQLTCSLDHAVHMERVDSLNCGMRILVQVLPGFATSA